MTSRHSEAAFETVIEAHLLENGYVPVAREGFDRERAIFPATVLAFIRETQPKEWAKLADDAVRVEVLYESETFWLDQRRLAELFGVDVRTVSEHLRNIYGSGGLSEGQLSGKSGWFEPREVARSPATSPTSSATTGTCSAPVSAGTGNRHTCSTATLERVAAIFSGTPPTPRTTSTLASDMRSTAQSTLMTQGSMDS